jgi:hypothetical protein
MHSLRRQAVYSLLAPLPVPACIPSCAVDLAILSSRQAARSPSSLPRPPLETGRSSAEYIKKTAEKQAREKLNVQSDEVRPIESKRADKRGHREESGLSAACRELGIAVPQKPRGNEGVNTDSRGK